MAVMPDAQSNLLRTAHRLLQLPSNNLPYNASYDKGPSEAVSPGEVNESAARRTAQPGAHLVDQWHLHFEEGKKIVDESDENDCWPLLPHLQSLRSITTTFLAPRLSRLLSSAPLIVLYQSLSPCNDPTRGQCGYARHICVSKRKNKFHAPLRPPIHAYLRLDTSSNPPSAPNLPPS